VPLFDTLRNATEVGRFTAVLSERCMSWFQGHTIGLFHGTYARNRGRRINHEIPQ